jgi:cardiolipin synthase
MSIPNILTILRILLIPLFVMAYSYNEFTLAAVLFILASLTDLLDGFLARLTGQVTKLGALLDPVADKLLLLSAFSLLVYRGIVPLWVLIIVLSKDVVVVSGWMIRFFLTRSSSAPPSFLGKVATFAQVVAITAELTSHLLAPIRASAYGILVVATVLTAISMLDYLYRGIKELEKRTKPS